MHVTLLGVQQFQLSQRHTELQRTLYRDTVSWREACLYTFICALLEISSCFKINLRLMSVCSSYVDVSESWHQRICWHWEGGRFYSFNLWRVNLWLKSSVLVFQAWKQGGWTRMLSRVRGTRLRLPQQTESRGHCNSWATAMAAGAWVEPGCGTWPPPQRTALVIWTAGSVAAVA